MKNLSAVVLPAVFLAGLSSATTITGFQSYSPVLTGGTVANFESFAEETIITNQYSGMTFSQTGGGAPMIDNYNGFGAGCSGSAWCYGYGADSGTGVLTGSTQGGNIITTAGIIVTFSSLQSDVQAFLSDTAPLGNYTISAYDSTHTLLGTVVVIAGTQLPPGYSGGSFPAPGTFPLPGLFVGFEDSVAEIASIQIGPSSSSGDAFAVDDVSFGGSPSSVPEPATLGLLTLGAFGLVSLRKFRRRN